ncbi:hypothetical protein D3C76_1752780 [compost metagenome]
MVSGAEEAYRVSIGTVLLQALYIPDSGYRIERQSILYGQSVDRPQFPGHEDDGIHVEQRRTPCLFQAKRHLGRHFRRAGHSV